MHLASTEVNRSFADLLGRDLGLEPFFAAAEDLLAAFLPFDSSCWLSLDPATLLPTSHVSRHHSSEQLVQIAINEYLHDDVNKFADLALAPLPVARLSAATNGSPMVSRRHRELLAPAGYADGDELRAVFVEGDLVRGCVALHRRSGLFSDAEEQLLADLSRTYLAAGCRRAQLFDQLAATTRTDGPGLLILGRSDVPEHVSPHAELMLREIVDSTSRPDELPLVVRTLAANVRARSRSSDPRPVAVRLPEVDGRQQVLYGSLVGGLRGGGGGEDGRVAVMLVSEVHPPTADAVAAKYSLSPREGQVLGLILQGRSTREIARRLDVTEYTVQDHLKRVFDKTGVRSRRDLVSKVFAQYYGAPLVPGSAPSS